METQSETKSEGGSRRGAPWRWLALLALALVPSGYLYLTGRQVEQRLTGRAEAAEAESRVLADSLDAARTQLLIDRVLVLAASGETERARELASNFFDRVDRRSRMPGAVASDTETRLRVLALRDETISMLTLGEPGAVRVLQEAARLHLGLADPSLSARVPTPVGPADSTGGADTVPRT